MPTRFRWAIVALIFFITMVNYVDRAALSYAVPGLRAEFGFDAAQVGRILGAFGLGYILTTFLGGLWADHYGARRTLFCACLFWSLAVGAIAFAGGFAMLYAARVLLGV